PAFRLGAVSEAAPHPAARPGDGDHALHGWLLGPRLHRLRFGLLRREMRIGVLSRLVPLAAAHAVESFHPLGADRLGPRREVEGDILPHVAALGLEAEAGGRLVAAVHHAVFTAR